MTVTARAQPLGSLVVWRASGPPPARYTPSKAFQLRVGHYWLDEAKDPNGLHFCTSSNPAATMWARLTDLAEGSQGGNVILGGAGNAALTGSNLVLIGVGAGASLDSCDDVVAVGGQAGSSAANGLVSFGWTAVGPFAGQAATGFEWTALGTSSGAVNTNGNQWVAVGAYAAGTCTDGTFWTAVGSHAGYGNVTGDYWVAVGRNAGERAEGSYNTFLGADTGVATGAESSVDVVCLGYGATATASGQFAIGSTSHPLNTHGTAGAVVQYLELNVNGTVYRVPLHTP